jgi:hypothetical protein
MIPFLWEVGMKFSNISQIILQKIEIQLMGLAKKVRKSSDQKLLNRVFYPHHTCFPHRLPGEQIRSKIYLNINQDVLGCPLSSWLNGSSGTGCYTPALPTIQPERVN